MDPFDEAVRYTEGLIALLDQDPRNYKKPGFATKDPASRSVWACDVKALALKFRGDLPAICKFGFSQDQSYATTTLFDRVEKIAKSRAGDLSFSRGLAAERIDLLRIFRAALDDLRMQKRRVKEESVLARVREIMHESAKPSSSKDVVHPSIIGLPVDPLEPQFDRPRESDVRKLKQSMLVSLLIVSVGVFLSGVSAFALVTRFFPLLADKVVPQVVHDSGYATGEIASILGLWGLLFIPIQYVLDKHRKK
jgi:hypothetical protein